MSTIAEVRASLAAACATVNGLRSSAYRLDAVAVPQAEVMEGAWDPRFVFAQGKATRDYIVTIYAGKVSERTAQALLDGYCEMTGSTSVIAAIQTATDLDGGSVADYAVVKDVSEPRIVTVGTVDYLAKALTVEVCH